MRAIVPNYVTSEQLAEILGVHPQTILRLAREGRLPSKRVGRALRFRVDEVDAALTQASVPPTTSAPTP